MERLKTLVMKGCRKSIKAQPQHFDSWYLIYLINILFKDGETLKMNSVSLLILSYKTLTLMLQAVEQIY